MNMRKLEILCFYVLLTAFWCASVWGQTSASLVKNGVVRIKVTDELAQTLGDNGPKTRSGVIKTGWTKLDEVGRQMKVIRMQRVFPYAPKFEERMKKHGLNLWYDVKYEKEIKPQNVVNLFQNMEGITHAEVIRVARNEQPKIVPFSGGAMPRTRSEAPSNDPLLYKQWHYHNDGTMNGSVAGSDINLYEAWKITTGSPNVLVAIIDGGIDYKHKDLAGRVWINEAEKNGLPGVDDDGNGYIDDVYGYNFVTSEPDIYPHNHGTHVAGTVGAINGNGVGVAGVAGGAKGEGGVRMMSCQVFDDRSDEGADFARALVYAANNGAVIASGSWGWNVPDTYDQAVLDAVDYFVQEAGQYEGSPMKGGICIIAAGNKGSEGNFYPGAYPTAFAVAAISFDYKVANYSNYGTWVDVSAPGGLMDFGSDGGVFSTLPNDGYGYMQGTSQATPHVSGIAALILSKYGNENYTPEMLWSRLKTAVHDIYQYNPEMKGKLGEGYIDAALALKEDQNKAPGKVTDFALYPTQSEMVTEWTIPADEDDGFVQKHVVYWSDKEFTASVDFSTLQYQEVDTKFKAAGEKMNVEIEGFKPETNYWLAIQAVDRWGHKSELSEIKMAKTNKGPEAHLNKNNVSLTLNVATDASAEAALQLSNLSEGLLKWNSSFRNLKAQVPANYSLKARSSVVPAAVSNYKGAVTFESPEVVRTVTADYKQEDYPQSISYYFFDTEFTPKVVGESDTTKTNSLAQWFVVDPELYPDGFNLTHVNIGGKKTKGKAILEIYSGDKLAKEYLLYSDTLNAGQNIFAADLALKEQLYFAPDESFWVVLHVARGNVNPLGACFELEEYYSDYSYYSSDMGKSWALLKDVLKEGTLAEYAQALTWEVTAISGNPDWTKWLVMEPASGMVRPEETTDIKFSTTGEGMINGTYNMRLTLNTNDPKNEKMIVPVTVKISGHKPELHAAKVVDFGKVFVGESQKLNVEIYNSGYGSFAGSYNAPKVESSNSQFKLDYVSLAFPARGKATLGITYTPTSAGSHTSTIKMTDRNGSVYSIIVSGTAITPAQITLDPETRNVGDLVYGDQPKQVTLTIKNEGGFPLEYVLPRFSEDTVSGLKKTSHKFGYSYISNLDDPTGYTYEWNDLLNTTDIKGIYGIGSYWSDPVEIGFQFPFYGDKFDKVYIGSFGAVKFTDTEGAMHSTFPPTADKATIGGMGLITAFGGGNLQFDGNSKLIYAKQNGNFVISYEDALAEKPNNSGFERISFRIVLCPNGNIELYYKNYKGNVLFNPAKLFIGCSDIEVDDPLILTDQDKVLHEKSKLYTKVKDGSAILIVAPERNMVVDVDKPSGVVAMGESETVTFTLAADTNMYKGALKNIITVLSNDPAHSTSYVYLNANVTGDYYKPSFEVDHTELDFGDVFQTATVSNAISVKNKGKATGEITGISLQNSAFTLSENSAFEVEAGRSVDLIVTVPTAAKGILEDVLTLTTADGETFTIPLKAQVADAPDITIAPATVNQTLESGGSKMVNYQITNNGAGMLNFTLSPSPAFYPVDNQAGEAGEFEYMAVSSLDSKEVSAGWIDITTTGEHKDFEYLQEHDFWAVDLPYPFPFFGKEYSKMYICMTGFITFTEYEDLNNLPGPVDKIPSPDHHYRNFIAPFWGNHSPVESKIAGIYYQTIGDEIIVSYMDYANSSSMGVCFQVILSRNGNIKYQYKLMEEYGIFGGTFGISGVENAEGTKGILIADRYIAMDQATQLYPVKVQQLAPGASETVDMIINTEGLMAGDYQMKAPIKTNVPTKPEVSLNADITVTGRAQAVYPESITRDEVLLYSNLAQAGEAIEFEVGNTGTAEFEITGTDYQMGNIILQYEMAQVEDDPFGGGSWQNLFGDETFDIGKTPQKFRLLVMAMPEEPMSIDEAITFYTTGLAMENITIPVKIDIVGTPQLGMDQGDYTLYAPNEEFLKDSVFTITNNGDYKLKYNIEVRYNNPIIPSPGDFNELLPSAAAMPASESVAIPAGAVLPQTKLAQAREGETGDETYPVDPEYTKTLSYPWGKPVGTMGSGEKYNSFVASVKYQAPAEGFNIAAIQYVGTVGPLESGTIRAEIRNGSESYLEAKVIAESEITVEGPEMETDTKVKNSLRTIVFKNPVYINPNETFYLFLHFPIGAPNVMAVSETTEAGVIGRYYAKVVDKWQDLASQEATYGPICFMTRCLEKVSGEPWLSVPEAKQGSIEPGESQSFTVHVNALQARESKGNNATILVSTNDPDEDNGTQSFRVALDKNSAPIITLPDKALSVKENETGEIRFRVKDNEGDRFEVKIEEEEGIATLVKDTLITLAPKFGQAGNHSVKIVAKDEYGYESAETVTYLVEKVNQKPVVVQIPDPVKIRLGEVLESIDLGAVFSDPDGDELTYGVQSDDESVVLGTLSGSNLEIVIKGTGEAELTISAVDPGKLGASTSFKVTVTDATNGLSRKEITAYPNPVVYLLSIRCPEDLSGDVTIRIYGTDGSLFYTEKTVIAPEAVKTVDMTNYPSGIYILEIQNKDEKLNTKVIKQ